MIDKGLLTRERSAKDARANSVGLTDLGRHTLSDMAPKVAAADSRLLAHLNAGKRDSFIKLLREFIRSGDEPQDDALEPVTKPKKKTDKAPKAEKKKKKKKKAANDLAI